MDTDIALVSGFFLILFVVPKALNGWTEGHFPRMTAGTGLLGLGLIAYALVARPTGYSFEDAGDAFVRVFRMIAG